jgi:hypothetical protein
MTSSTRHRLTSVAFAAVVAVTLAACGGGDPAADAAASSAASLSSAAAASSSAAEASEAAVISSNRAAASSAAASRSAEAAAAAAASSAAAEAARRVPTVVSGSGDDVVSITKPPGVTVAVAAIEYDGRRNFAVKGLDGEEDLLVNTIGSYSGSVLFDADSGGTTMLEVTASGPWTITISDALLAPPLNAGANNGTGDAVLLYQGGGTTRAAISGQSEGNFAVVEYSSGGSDLLVNEIGSYDGVVPLVGPALVEITSEGPWSIAVG